MKLIIQIPCYNEEETLPETVADLPTEIEGVDVIEYLIIDDGSRDRTTEVARELGIHHIVRFTANRGLARGFMAGVDACLRLGADVIVNTDADNQYVGQDIPKLVKPIVHGEADMVVGDRQVDSIDHFSPTKKRLQHFGSWVVRQASSTSVVDATSGFRALSRQAAMQLFVVNEFTYTLETLIQAGHHRLNVESVPIRTNPKTRESRLFKGMPEYLRRAGSTIVRVYAMYQPLKTFSLIALICALGGSALFIKFFIAWWEGDPEGHLQALIASTLLFNAGFLALLVGIVADLVAANRKMLEENLARTRRIEYATLDGESFAPYAPEESLKQDVEEPGAPPSASGAPPSPSASGAPSPSGAPPSASGARPEASLPGRGSTPGVPPSASGARPEASLPGRGSTPGVPPSEDEAERPAIPAPPSPVSSRREGT